jgi:hypothetical protein
MLDVIHRRAAAWRVRANGVKSCCPFPSSCHETAKNCCSTRYQSPSVIQLLTCDSRNMQALLLSIVGSGTVGRWLAAAIGRHCSWFEPQHGVSVVGVANRRDGFVYRDAGFDTTTLLEFVSAGRPLGEYPGGRQWETAVEGLTQTECDVVAEASGTNPCEPEPALSHIRQALGRGTHVITSRRAMWRAPPGREPFAMRRQLTNPVLHHAEPRDRQIGFEIGDGQVAMLRQSF